MVRAWRSERDERTDERRRYESCGRGTQVSSVVIMLMVRQHGFRGGFFCPRLLLTESVCVLCSFGMLFSYFDKFSCGDLNE